MGRGVSPRPALPATAAEMLLDGKEHDEARRLLEAALGESPDDLRLNQLMGLYWSRTGNLREALRLLEPLHARYLDDGETAGITAGVYKRLWKSDKSDGKWLEQSHRAYRHGWDASRQSNAYLGVNAATTALWLGRPEDAREIAASVRRLLQRRAAALAKHTADPDLVLNYWDHVTLAEAHLLLGEYAAARAAYVEAFARHAECLDNIAVSRGQLGDILRRSGRRAARTISWRVRPFRPPFDRGFLIPTLRVGTRAPDAPRPETKMTGPWTGRDAERPDFVPTRSVENQAT